MFGASSASKPSGFSFGASPAPTAGATGGGFSFGASTPGATTPAPASTSFSFGSGTTAATPASIGFGGFGSTSSTAAPATGSSGFSFGATSTSTAAPAASGGFGFGTTTSTAAPAASGGFNFGSATSTAAPAAGGGFGFGGGTATGATGSTGTTGFGFGSSGATTSTTPSLFGGTTTAAAPSAGGFGFGAGTTGATSTFGAKPAGSAGFGFGTGSTGTGTTGTTGFGFGSGGFGATPATNTTGFGTLGGGTSTFGAAPAAVTTPAPIIMGGDAAVAQLNSIKYAYQDQMQSRFKFLMYNTVDPSQRHLYVRPPHISERLWEQVEQDNPDPLNCVPVPITGFKDLLKRVQVQQEYAEKYNTFTDDLRTQLKEMEKTSRATEEKLEKCRHEHVQLAHMLVKIMKDIEFLQNLGKPLQREEMNLAMALKKLQTLLDAPGQYKARLNDAIALQRVQETATAPPANQLSSTDLQRIYQFLDKQRQGLEHLTNLLNEDLADIKLMKETWRR